MVTCIERLELSINWHTLLDHLKQIMYVFLIHKVSQPFLSVMCRTGQCKCLTRQPVKHFSHKGLPHMSSSIGSLAVCLQLPSSALVQHHSLYMLGFLRCDLQSTPYLSVQHCPSAFFCAWQYQMSFRDRLEAYQLRWRRSVAEQRQRNLI